MIIQFRSLTAWPAHQSATPHSKRENGLFRAAYPDRLSLLESELDKIRGRDVVLEMGLPKSKTRRDGWPMSDSKTEWQVGPGVILSFTDDGQPREMVADRYRDWRDNLYAIAKALEALRAVDRWGLTRRGAQYEGFRPALPAPASAMTRETAALFLAEQSGVQSPLLLSDQETQRVAYRLAAAKLHPDAGGSTEQFKLLQEAKEVLDKR